VPILITPPPPREFKDKKLVATNLADYATAMKQVAQETNTPVIDLYQEVATIYDTLGEAGSAAMTVNKGGWDAQRDDRVHYTEEGARQLAFIVAKALPAADPKLSVVLKSEPVPNNAAP
jgi:lysophospholipase L1-like esterase